MVSRFTVNAVRGVKTAKIGSISRPNTAGDRARLANRDLFDVFFEEGTLWQAIRQPCP
jgi:hypothetical protein